MVEYLLEADRKQNVKGCLCNLGSQYIVGIFLRGNAMLSGWVDLLMFIDDLYLRDGCTLKSVCVDNLLF